MRATRSGIEMNKAELAALLAFTGDEQQFSVVHLRVTDQLKLIAAATDGKRAVQCIAKAVETTEAGEWHIDRTFLEQCRRALDANETNILLKATAKGLREALVQGIESGDWRQKVIWPTEAASTQITLDAVDTVIGKKDNLHGSWFALNPFYLSDVTAVAKAADKCPVSIFPPTDDKSPVHFEASAEGGIWRGVIMPVTVRGPGGEQLVPDDVPPGAPGAAEEFSLQAQNAGADKKRRPKASKPTKKKPAAPKRGFMHLIDSANKNGTHCGTRVGTSVGSGANSSPKFVNCPKCLEKLGPKAAGKKASKKKGR